MFEKGTYLIDSTASDTPNGTYHSLYFKGLNDITLEGNGATLMINDPYMDVFYFERCKSVTIKGFNIDYSTDPWVQGEISAVDKTNNTFTLRINNLNENKCVLDDARWSTLTANFGMVRDDDNPLLFKQEMANYFFGCNNVTRTSANGDLYKFTLSEATGSDTIELLQNGKIAVGSKIIINARIASVGAFRFLYCDGDIKVKDSKVYATNGTAFCVGAVNGNVTVDNVDVLLTKNRWTTSNADGIYSSNICGALKIKNCTWEGLSDDCINLYPQGAAITQVISNNTIKVKGGFLPKVGDSITVLDPINGNVRGDAKVTAISYNQQYDEIWDNRNIAVLTLDKEVSGINPCDENYDRTQYIDLRLTGDIIINHKVQSPGTEIINNTFRYGRDKGVKINVRDFKIMNNTFEYLSGSAVRLHNIPWYVESGGSANGIISNNTITNCSYLSHGNSVYNSPISLYGMAMDNATDTAGMIHSNITISNNTITSVKQAGIFVSSAKDVKILDNTIIGLDTDGTKVKAGIYLKNSDNVEVSGNNINVPSSYLSAGIVKESSATNITIGTNTYNLANGKPATATN